MSNTSNNLQTQTSNTLHNAIMEAGSKDRLSMLAPVRIHETYKNVSQEIRDQLNAEAEAVQIILTGIDNDIYSTVDACLNACEMWKAIERMVNHWNRITQEWQRFVTLIKQSQELKTVSYHKLYDILKQHQHKVNKIKAERIARVANPLALVAQQQPQSDWKDDTDDDELEDQELEAHYMYMAQLQQVSPDAANSGPIFDDEPLQKVSNDNYYNVFAMESTHPEQSKSVHDTYPIEQDAQNKEAQIKLYKTQEDKELDKVIELENKVKVLDNIVYKTGQSVQTMNMLNNKCQTSFAKPEFLNKAQRANPRLYDIDSDHAGYIDSRKSTSGGIQLLGGDKLVSWSSKKQDCTSMSVPPLKSRSVTRETLDRFTRDEN
nr:Gag-Pol polyprotein [Tanacetum cinerariifolium]GEY86137.1 Gag-Pol polyprotein [Tanacetum cinerariifolium]